MKTHLEELQDRMLNTGSIDIIGSSRETCEAIEKDIEERIKILDKRIWELSKQHGDIIYSKEFGEELGVADNNGIINNLENRKIGLKEIKQLIRKGIDSPQGFPCPTEEELEPYKKFEIKDADTKKEKGVENGRR